MIIGENAEINKERREGLPCFIAMISQISGTALGICLNTPRGGGL